MARAAVEEALRREGAEKVTVERFREIAARFGMGHPDPGGRPDPGAAGGTHDRGSPADG
jgi:hypothetical protein